MKMGIAEFGSGYCILYLHFLKIYLVKIQKNNDF